MKISEKEIQQRMDRFTAACRDAGAKLTHQRLEIFREIAQTGTHPDAETVFQGVRERMPTLSLDTVYRTLWWLKDLGLVHALGTTRERTRFDANLDNHHHFVCKVCGRTMDFYSKEFDQLKMEKLVQDIGHVDAIQVEIKGICSNCTAGRRSETR